MEQKISMKDNLANLMAGLYVCPVSFFTSMTIYIYIIIFTHKVMSFKVLFMLCLVMIANFLPHCLTLLETIVKGDQMKHTLPWRKIQISLRLNIVGTFWDGASTLFNNIYNKDEVVLRHFNVGIHIIPLESLLGCRKWTPESLCTPHSDICPKAQQHCTTSTSVPESPLLGGCKHAVGHFKCLNKQPMSNKEGCLIMGFKTALGQLSVQW